MRVNDLEHAEGRRHATDAVVLVRRLQPGNQRLDHRQHALEYRLTDSLKTEEQWLTDSLKIEEQWLTDSLKIEEQRFTNSLKQDAAG